MRVLALALGSLLVLAVVLMGARFWGLSLPTPEFNHPFFSSNKPWIAVEVLSLGEAHEALKKKSDLILDVPVRLSKDEVLFVQAPQIFENDLRQMKMDPKEYQGLKPYLYNFSHLQKMYPSLIPLEKFLIEFPDQRMILNILDNAPDVHKVLNTTLKNHSAEKRFLIQSDTDVVLKSIKDLQPLWAFGTSNAEIMRLLSFQSLGVLPAVQMRSDIYISPLKEMNRRVFNEDLLLDLRRRKKHVLLGPVNSLSEFNEARSFAVDGFIFSSLSLIESANLLESNSHQ